MNEPRPEFPQTTTLRERAEKAFREMLDGSLDQLDSLSSETLRASLYELRVHQIELEMQNEDLLRAQEALDGSRARYFDLYDMAPVGYCTVSEKGQILEANLTAATLFGVERGALVGRSLSDFISKEDQEIYYWCRKKLLDTRQPQQCDLRMARHDGTAFFAHLEVTAAKDEADAPVGHVALIDVTEHKRGEETLRESEARYAQLAEQSSTVTWEVDAQGLYTYVSQVSETVWGYRPDELMGRKHFYELHPESERGEYKASAFAVFARKQPFVNFVNAIQTKDGRQVWVSTNGSPILNAEGTLCGYRGSDTDITERKEMDAKLLEALDRAEAANRAKSEFLGVMSHELRTPLNGVLGFAQLLADTPLDSEQKEFAETISNSGEHLLAIVNDILDFSSIDAGTLAIHVAPLAVADLVKTAEDPVRKTAAEKGIELRCELAAGVPEQIVGDAHRIRQILINLLGNAVKFTSAGSVVLRVATASDEGRRFLDFCVKDTGIGISSDELTLLFQPFVQADSKKNRRFGGTGLGLAISRRIAEAMGGTITVASTPGKGSAFTFRFPLEVSAGGMAAVPSDGEKGPDENLEGAAPSAPTFPIQKNGTARRPSLQKTTGRDALPVLVVEDDQACGVLAGKMLQSLGYRAEFATDGTEAVKAFVPGKYSAVLMDVSMPVMGGLEATKKIREIEAAAGCHVPIIALTANVMPGDRERCLAAGMDDFLAKPLKRDGLAAKLQTS